MTWLLMVLGIAAAGTDLSSVLIEDVPHIEQKPDFCGEACIEMVLRKMGHDIDQDEVFARTGLDPALGRGAWTKEMKVALEDLGFEPGRTWHWMPAGDRAALDSAFATIHTDLQRGVPTIVCTRYDALPDTTEHFRLVVGYDAEKDEVIFHDPAVEKGAYMRMDRASFLGLWPLKYEAKRWLLVRMPMQAGPNLKPARSGGPGPAAFAQHVMQMKVPDGFSVVVEPPFVVIGNEDEARVRARSEQTVRWAVTRLKKQYFPRDPDEIWEIWLFDGHRSYKHYAHELWGDDPETPYGYAVDGRLVMNIATGGGTLVHEIVHPYVDTNFPSAPSWFNEGLASLYEQSGSRDGKIVGFTNWRLAGLQQSLDADEVSLQMLTATTRFQFYERDPGWHYGASRYLMLWLQEQGKLEEFYRRFVAEHTTDPTGIATLQAVIGTEDLEAWQRDVWAPWVATLTF